MRHESEDHTATPSVNGPGDSSGRSKKTKGYLSTSSSIDSIVNPTIRVSISNVTSISHGDATLLRDLVAYITSLALATPPLGIAWPRLLGRDGEPGYSELPI
eukprot:gnl/Dysnectes_brevis/11117_a22988_150.p2 GENE.gnl/Dysnectes_brevis/11117_a22988_150~~gnl/Dysnectes_brevis/11117_a22988_150.p2  ORF type:complete len:102 (-),score=8.52 gnl/Dysnectes_brevis/11117_a22988_150:130-435(-)